MFCRIILQLHIHIRRTSLGKKVNVAVKRCSRNVWADIVLNYALNKLTLCTKYCKYLHVALHKAEGVNVLHAEVIAPRWRHREESSRHNKDEHEGKELVEQRERFTSSLQKEWSSESPKKNFAIWAGRKTVLTVSSVLKNRWQMNPLLYRALAGPQNYWNTLPIKALYQFIFCPAVRMMCFWPCRFHLLGYECSCHSVSKTVQDLYVLRLGPGSNQSLSDVKKANKATKDKRQCSTQSWDDGTDVVWGDKGDTQSDVTLQNTVFNASATVFYMLLFLYL